MNILARLLGNKKSDLAESEAKKPKTRKDYMEQRRKKRIKIMRIGGGIFAFLIFLIWYGLQPLTATPQYGICKTFVERYVQYPSSLRITMFDIFSTSTRIFFTHRDGSGSERSEVIECRMVEDIQNIYLATGININRQPISQQELNMFNLTIPSIMAGNPDLTVPNPPANNSLYALKRD